MSIRWSDEETSKLIDLYKTYPFLWDSGHKWYKKAQARKLAYDAILEKMQKPKLTTRDIRCKVKNLRSAYYQEIKKRSQGAYASSLSWFNDFREIMESVQNKSDYVDDEDETSNYDKRDTYVVSIKQEFIDEMEHKDIRYCSAISDYLEPSDPVTKKKKRISKQRESKTELDEFQIFANTMAEQLRNMPLDKALNLQVEVQALIAKERIGMIDNICDVGDEEPDE